MVGCAFDIRRFQMLGFFGGLDVLKRRCFLSYSEELLVLILDCVFGGCGGFSVGREENHDVMESFTNLSAKPVGVSLAAGVLGGHVKVDHILTHDDV